MQTIQRYDSLGQGVADPSIVRVMTGALRESQIEVSASLMVFRMWRCLFLVERGQPAFRRAASATDP